MANRESTMEDADCQVLNLPVLFARATATGLDFQSFRIAEGLRFTTLLPLRSFQSLKPISLDYNRIGRYNIPGIRLADGGIGDEL
jgi:hypothetical protein